MVENRGCNSVTSQSKGTELSGRKCNAVRRNMRGDLREKDTEPEQMEGPILCSPKVEINLLSQNLILRLDLGLGIDKGQIKV